MGNVEGLEYPVKRLLVLREGPAARSRDGEEMRGAARWDIAVGGPDRCSTVTGPPGQCP